MLTVVTPYQTSPTRQRAQVYLWTAVIIIMFSILISFFRVKNRSTFTQYYDANISLTLSDVRRLSVPTFPVNKQKRRIGDGAADIGV